MQALLGHACSIASLTVLLIACGGEGARSTTGSSDAPEPNPRRGERAKAADPCSADALSLGAATTLATWQPPTGCSETPAQGTALHRTEPELAAQLQCDAASDFGVDLAKHSILRVTDSMSPATIGWLAYDDGKVITLVTKFRAPCPDDPQPMPMTTTRWYLAPQGDRTLAAATCTVHPECPKH